MIRFIALCLLALAFVAFAPACPVVNNDAVVEAGPLARVFGVYRRERRQARRAEGRGLGRWFGGGCAGGACAGY